MGLSQVDDGAPSAWGGFVTDFDAAYLRVRRTLRRRLIRQGQTSEQADDAVQHAVLTALASGMDFADVDSFVRYCYVVARNHVTDEWRGGGGRRGARPPPPPSRSRAPPARRPTRPCPTPPERSSFGPAGTRRAEPSARA